MSDQPPSPATPSPAPPSPSIVYGGNATVMVTDMDRAVSFYVDTLGLRLAHRAGADWAMIDAGQGLTIGLHSSAHGGPKPGTMGSISVGFSVNPPIEEAVEALAGRGVQFRGPVSETGFVKLVFFADPDGNALYLAETPTRRRHSISETKPFT